MEELWVEEKTAEEESIDAGASPVSSSVSRVASYASADAPIRTAPASQRSGSYKDETEVLALFRRMRGPVEGVRHGDRTGLRDHLVLMHTPLVEHCARGFSASGEPVEDLVQEGYIGLIKAVDRFDPDKAVRFSTYACHLISGEMRHYLRDRGKLIHEPGWHAQLRQRIERAREQLTHRLNRVPQPEEIAVSLDIPVQTVYEVLNDSNVLAVESLDAGADSDSANGEGNGGGDADQKVGREKPALNECLASDVENRLMLDTALPQLRDLEKRAITLFYYGECSKTEIARRLGISVNYAAYLIKRGVERLRHIIETDGVVTPVVAAKPAGRAAGAVPAVERPFSFAQLTRFIEEETGRAERAEREFAVLLFQIHNWEEATASLDSEQKEEARQAAEVIARRSCRLTDKVAVVPDGTLAGLNFMVLLPNTGPPGQRVGERWTRSCTSAAVSPSDPDAIGDLTLEYTFLCFPRDGRTANDLMQALNLPINDEG